ncbi:MAG TPA: hypothetical protein PKD12_03830 [Nitrospira sp.]|nr:hypothetical protein [Nitrospira sp.]
MVSTDVKRAISIAVESRPGLSMDDLILCCAPYSWNQIFLALNELVRKGAITMSQGGGLFLITPCGDTTKREPSPPLYLGSQI